MFADGQCPGRIDMRPYTGGPTLLRHFFAGFLTAVQPRHADHEAPNARGCTRLCVRRILCAQSRRGHNGLMARSCVGRAAPIRSVAAALAAVALVDSGNEALHDRTR